MHSKFSTIDNDCLHMFLNISLMFKRKGKSKKKIIDSCKICKKESDFH